MRIRVGKVDALFSKYAHENDSNLKEEFDEFCKCCSFDTEEVKGHPNVSEKSNYDGHYLQYLLGYDFKVKGEDTTFILNVAWTADNVNDESQIGIQYIELFKKENASPGKLWGYETNKCGFHIF